MKPDRGVTNQNADDLRWKCTNPECGERYAEYVNGCPCCKNGSVHHVSYSSEQAALIESKLFATTQ
jgi:hypothetical protein